MIRRPGKARAAGLRDMFGWSLPFDRHLRDRELFDALAEAQALRRVRSRLCEAANIVPTRYKGPLKLKDWALAIARRSTMREARIALAAASPSSRTPCSGMRETS